MHPKNALLKEAHDLLHKLIEGSFACATADFEAIEQLHRRIARNFGLVELD